MSNNNDQAGDVDQLKKQNTLSLLASLIASPRFPEEEHISPSIPIPFTNFGHQPFIDHELLQHELWRVISKIQNAIKPWNKKKKIFNIINLCLALIVGFVFVVWVGDFAPGIVVGFVLFVCGRYLIAMGNTKCIENIADIRAQELEKILSSNVDTYQVSDSNSHSDIIRERMRYIGNGDLDGEKIPVITIIEDGDPFPGYGRLQLENTFVCRPKDDNNGSQKKGSAIAEEVFSEVKKNIFFSDSVKVSCGKVATVYGDSINIDSRWLDKNKTPILWVDKNQVDDFLLSKDSEESRLYYAISLVFPEYNAMATLFFRVFLAGNSASCHMSLSTIGPPVFDKQLIRKMILKYKISKEKKSSSSEEDNFSKSKKDKSGLLSSIKIMKALTMADDDFIDESIELSSILDLKIENEGISDKKDKAEFDKEFNDIVGKSAIWPGNIGLRNSSVRDANSYSFVTGFYDKPELLAAVRTMYDQVSRAILDSFDKQGFNITEYRDKEGNYSINAEKIDNLVIGEKIHIKKEDAKESTPEKAESKE